MEKIGATAVVGGLVVCGAMFVLILVCRKTTVVSEEEEKILRQQKISGPKQHVELAERHRTPKTITVTEADHATMVREMEGSLSIGLDANIFVDLRK